jgi:hypothetical protein
LLFEVIEDRTGRDVVLEDVVCDLHYRCPGVILVAGLFRFPR